MEHALLTGWLGKVAVLPVLPVDGVAGDDKHAAITARIRILTTMNCKRRGFIILAPHQVILKYYSLDCPHWKIRKDFFRGEGRQGMVRAKFGFFQIRLERMILNTLPSA